jgi:D-alanyl-lipoteichoic acid acyltransferase DltB (MBOAT superfamily)
MSFLSVFYLLFLAITATVFYLLPAKLRTFWLLVAGYFFYFTWQPAFTLVLFCITLLSFQFAGKIASISDEKSKKRWLVSAVLTLLSPLIFFKYFNFLHDNLTGIFGLLSFENTLPLQPYLVPLGISFFTFQAISYVVDVYRGYLKPEPRIEKYAVYMAFFPTLLAGPIERAKSMLGQIGNPVSFDYQNIRAGLQLILWGVFKKVVLADRMGDFMNKVYAEPQNFQGIFIYFALAFAVFQLFCDFSAYSDIAVGSARILGIKLSKNFDDRVYAAPSREVFWRGWHRSLTSWLRDYIFFPLSRRVKTRARLYFNLILVYLLVGLWHGAAWGFIIWGLLNGVWLVVENATKDWRQQFFERLGVDTNGSRFYFFAWLIVFHVAALFGVFFRTASPDEAFAFIGNIVNSNVGWLARWETKSCAITIILLVLMDLINRQIPQNENFGAFIGKQKTWIRWAIYILLTQMILRYLFVFDEVQFMYFNF